MRNLQDTVIDLHASMGKISVSARERLEGIYKIYKKSDSFLVVFIECRGENYYTLIKVDYSDDYLQSKRVFDFFELVAVDGKLLLSPLFITRMSDFPLRRLFEEYYDYVTKDGALENFTETISYENSSRDTLKEP